MSVELLLSCETQTFEFCTEIHFVEEDEANETFVLLECFYIVV